MRVRIHRGAAEVGDNCVELEAGGERLLLDVGWPLTATDGEDVPLPSVAGLADGDDSGPHRGRRHAEGADRERALALLCRQHPRARLEGGLL